MPLGRHEFRFVRNFDRGPRFGLHHLQTAFPDYLIEIRLWRFRYRLCHWFGRGRRCGFALRRSRVHRCRFNGHERHRFNHRDGSLRRRYLFGRLCIAAFRRRIGAHFSGDCWRFIRFRGGEAEILLLRAACVLAFLARSAIPASAPAFTVGARRLA